ncbi:MAG: 2-C-methyl-D-erythritol 4-phosphate cytidylyltransferase [Gemmatimonadota bacterium]
MTVAAVVVAAGSGERLGGRPKQFRPLGDRPLLAWSCALLATHPEVRRLVVVLPAEVAADPPDWLAEYGPTVVSGGPTRRASVGRGLAEAGASEFVLIHDAARPFASPDMISRLLAAARIHGAVIPVLELADAVKRLEAAAPESPVSVTLDRAVLRAAQTPQVFPLEQIRRLHELAERSGRDVPDDAALCEGAGIEVWTIRGERWAFKITHAEDLALAEWLVASGRVRPADGT